MVADSSIGLVETIPGASCGGSEEVSLTAVPAKRAKPSWIDEARCRGLER